MEVATREFKMRVVERAVVEGRKGSSVGTGSSVGKSRFVWTMFPFQVPVQPKEDVT